MMKDTESWTEETFMTSRMKTLDEISQRVAVNKSDAEKSPDERVTVVIGQHSYL